MQSKSLGLWPLILIAVCLSVTNASSSHAWDEGANVRINSDVSFQLQNEEACVINPLDPNNVVAVWRDFRLGYRRVGVGRSTDGGVTWTDSLISVPPYDYHSDPVMSFDDAGNILICILAFPSGSGHSGLFVYRSSDGGVTWSNPITAIDQGVGGLFEDKQWMTVDRTGGPYNGRIYITWARISQNGKIFSVHSTSASNFSTPVQVSDIGNSIWSTTTVVPDGTVLIAWINRTQSRISLDRSTDGGDSWGVDKTVVSLGSLPESINGGIQVFPYPAMDADISASNYSGRTYIIYSGYAEDGNTDLYSLVSSDNGDSWGLPIRVNDDPPGNHIDQFHPSISITESGIVTATWYDRRNDPDNLQFDCYMAHSFDGGLSWTANRRISEVSSSPDQAFILDQVPELDGESANSAIGKGSDSNKNPRAGLIGEYTGLSAVADLAHVVFTDTRNLNQDAYSARVTIGFMAPPLASPASGTKTASNHPTLSWRKSGATPTEITNFPGTTVQPLYYQITVDDDSTFSSPDFQQSDITEASYQFASPLADGKWYWRVEAVNDSGRITGYSEPFRYFSIDTKEVGEISLILPAVDSTVDFQSQLFSWTPVDLDSSFSPVVYQLQVATDSAFANVVLSQTELTSPSYENSSQLPDRDTLYFRVRASDEVGVIGTFTTPRRFLTTSAFLCGDADGNDIVTVSDVVFLIDYIFSGGSAPDPPESADVDCSGIVSISDAVYLINFIFSGGAVPCVAC